MKKTMKRFNPAFTVDLTKCETPYMVLATFALAKIKSGLVITYEEYIGLLSVGIYEVAKNVIGDHDAIILTKEMTVHPAYICNNPCENCACTCKKPNIFKRFWNWITRKK